MRTHEFIATRSIAPAEQSVTRIKACLVPRRLSLDENMRLNEGGKETTGKSGTFCLQDGGKSNVGRICNFKIREDLFILRI